MRAHVIVVGNIKGGSGKSTTAVHLALSLMEAGYAVVCVDADVHQHSLGRFLENRRATALAGGRPLALPAFATLDREPGALDHRFQRGTRTMIEGISALHDVVVVDTAGSNTSLARGLHALADTILTPINDSFVDLDVLAHVAPAGAAHPDAVHIGANGVYADLVAAARERRRQREGLAIDWIVVRNRLSFLDARNKRYVEQVLSVLERRLGFRSAPGFGERVIFRELFPKGLTLLDLGEETGGGPMTLSHVAARQELRSLMEALDLAPPGGGAFAATQAG